ncbi:hypothetical protein BBW65_00010 [Helicobacter enhydrae]|nr:motility associated factor glycosyltransferase family protein [Helicobacter enhydrae]ANV97308.1 hypothetical protein BBW65_00010 [Helicobacter enhydrae]
MSRDAFVLELSSPFVGNAGVALASALGSDVILCGLDCGYIEGHSKHAQGSYYGDEGVQIPKDAFEVRGNKDKKVFSNAIYALSSKMMSLAFGYYKPNLVLNLGSGAWIEGSMSVEVGSFSLKEKTKDEKQKAIEQIKSMFAPNVDSVDFGASCNRVFDFVQELREILRTHITTKPELFALIDRINAKCFAKSASDPFVGILLEGSVYQMLQNLMMCVLHYPHLDISKLYVRCVDEVLIALDKMAMRLKMML